MSSRTRRRLLLFVWRFAERPSIRSEVFIPTLVVFGLVGCLAWRLLSPTR